MATCWRVERIPDEDRAGSADITLILSNEEIDALLDMGELIDVLEDAYRELAEGRGGTRLRSDIITPTTLREDGLYALKSMDGVIPKLGVGAIRINSDILTFPETGTGMRRVKVPAFKAQTPHRASIVARDRGTSPHQALKAQGTLGRSRSRGPSRPQRTEPA